MDNWRDLALSEAGLSNRVVVTLQRHGFQTMGQLDGLTEAAILTIPNLGSKALDEIRGWLLQRPDGSLSRRLKDIETKRAMGATRNRLNAYRASIEAHRAMIAHLEAWIERDEKTLAALELGLDR